MSIHFLRPTKKWIFITKNSEYSLFVFQKWTCKVQCKENIIFVSFESSQCIYIYIYTCTCIGICMVAVRGREEAVCPHESAKSRTVDHDGQGPPSGWVWKGRGSSSLVGLPGLTGLWNARKKLVRTLAGALRGYKGTTRAVMPRLAPRTRLFLRRNYTTLHTIHYIIYTVHYILYTTFYRLHTICYTMIGHGGIVEGGEGYRGVAGDTSASRRLLRGHRVAVLTGSLGGGRRFPHQPEPDFLLVSRSLAQCVQAYEHGPVGFSPSARQSRSRSAWPAWMGRSLRSEIQESHG